MKIFLWIFIVIVILFDMLAIAVALNISGRESRREDKEL